MLFGLLVLLGLGGCSSSSSEADPDPVVSIAAASVTEGDSGLSTLDFVVTSTKASSTAIMLTYTITAGTATVVTDYTDNSGTVDIPATTTSVTISVPVIGDTEIEDDETLILTLSAASGATLGTASAVGTIVNDDNADPSGYYSSGSATIKDPGDVTSDLSLSDLKAMVNDNRMLIVSPSTPIVYDVTITDVTQNDFTADVTLYYGMDGDYNVFPPDPVVTTMTGTITEGSQISGTIEGTGIGTGSISLTYSQTNSTNSDITNVVSSWKGAINTVSQIVFDFNISNTAGDIAVGLGSNANDGIFEGCRMTGSISPIADSTLYSLSVNMTESTCGEPTFEGDYTGFATTTDSNHDTLVTVFTNGTVSFSAELAKP